MIRVLLLAVAVALTQPVSAADFTLRPLTLKIPAGFEGPIRADRENLTTVAFTKSGGSSAKTLLQVSLYDFGATMGSLSEVEKAAAASKYLLDFVGGVERQRTSFKRTDPAPLKISGVPAAKLQWTGQLKGLDTVGVMYCFIVGSKVVSFHTQDLGSTPTAAMAEAMKSFESTRVEHGG